VALRACAESMKLSDIAGCTGGALFLLLAAHLIPMFGIFTGMLIPLPFLYYSVKLGRVEGAKTAALAFFAVFLVMKFIGLGFLVISLIEMAVLGLVLAELYRREAGIGRIILLGTASITAVGFFLLLIFAPGGAPGELVAGFFKGNFDAYIRAYEESGSGTQVIEQLQALEEKLVRIVRIFYPSILIFGSIAVTWINVLVSLPLLRAGRLKTPRFESMDRWQAPEKLVWLFIGAGFAFFLPWGHVKFAASNAMAILAVVYFFQGLSILQFYMNKYSLSRFLKAFVYLLILIQHYLVLGLVIAGLFDQWFDIRRIFGPAKDSVE